MVRCLFGEHTREEWYKCMMQTVLEINPTHMHNMTWGSSFPTMASKVTHMQFPLRLGFAGAECKRTRTNIEEAGRRSLFKDSLSWKAVCISLSWLKICNDLILLHKRSDNPGNASAAHSRHLTVANPIFGEAFQFSASNVWDYSIELELCLIVTRNRFVNPSSRQLAEKWYMPYVAPDINKCLSCSR